MLKIKEDIDLKELEKYGFIEYKKEYARHYKSDIETCIDKETREIFVEVKDNEFKKKN